MNHIQQNLEKTTTEVIQKSGNPVSAMVVLATLESFGIREKDVFKDYGFVSIMDLAIHIYEDLLSRPIETLVNINELKKRKKHDSQIPVSGYLWMKAKLLAQFYPLGLFHLLPIFLQVAAIIFFGYSLWTFVGFNIIQSTSVVFGVILGLIISGGYVQVMGRQASFYWHHEEFTKARMVMDKLIKSGINGMLLSFLALGMINFFFNLYPFSFVLVMFTYALLIGTLLLVSAPFHTIRQRWAITLSISIATLFALALKEFSSLHIYLTHWIGVLVAIFLSKTILWGFFKVKGVGTESVHVTPSKSMVIYRNYPYFFYGGLIYIFIFIDRILAWSADFTLTHQYVFLYEKDYEIGMDLAILIFFMLAGVLEYAIASFSKFLDIKQKNTPFLNRKEFNRRMYRMYRGHIFLLVITALVTTTLIYLIITQPWGYEASFNESLDVLSIKVCIIGGIGYLFLTWGMLNALYLFTLSKPNGVLSSLMISCVVNFVVGFTVSRIFAYEYSVVGMLVGSIVFMTLTLREIKSFYKNLDYYYYAAY
ncbi:hypothetical protein [Maribacter sp. HTCC2170]|uniref:hypothetical protein n=1 Tax=Maribacter sp. (strain HTCC2170 / KCCM 42371) TaxID=313603 RepID=UPI00006BD35D|nr:hypothetical protein [Maribacter sp. HTCC2170]EAR02553.1 hypothetical protein FB2170_04680 [Maribacter sp. HTCC2170]